MVKIIKEICYGVFYLILFIAALLYIQEKMINTSQIIDVTGEKITCSN
jgi:hypothetical protein